jgi:hypothetical protein
MALTLATPDRRVRMIVTLTALLSVTASPGSAGTLSFHPDAYGGVTGAVPFNGAGFSGEVDFAVFTAADFDANFSGLGYVPGAEFVYTYQLLVDTGSEDITKFLVELGGPANTIGKFDLGGQPPSMSAFDSYPYGQWSFRPALEDGTTSWGLAFSSPTLPIFLLAEVVVESSSTLVAVPSPSQNYPVPEPSSFLFVGFGVLFLLGSRRRC